jgi:hypothetical protein
MKGFTQLEGRISAIDDIDQTIFLDYKKIEACPSVAPNAYEYSIH